MPIVAEDQFRNTPGVLANPCDDMVPITPSDTDELPYVGRAVYVSTAGNLQYKSAKGFTRLIPVAAQSWHPIRARQIFASNTTAGGIFIGY